MLKINSAALQPANISYETKKPKTGETSFKGTTTPPAVLPGSEYYRDYCLKTPMPYAKTGEIALPYNIKAHLYKMANGQQVVIIPKEGKTFLETYVNTGSMNEFDNIRGISHYIEHNLFNGSDGLEAGEFFATTDKMGAVTNASTSFAETNYFIGSNLLNEGDLEKKIKIHASMIQTPKFAQDMLEKEKGIVNSEINMLTSNPDNIAFNATLKNLFGYQSKCPDLIGGSTENITNLTKKDVEDYYNRNYYPANMVTVVSGEVNPDETMMLLSKYFTSTKSPSGNTFNEPVKEIEKTIREDIFSEKATSAVVNIGFTGPENNNTRDRILVDALFTLINNSPELNKELKSLNTAVFPITEKVGTQPSAKRAIMLDSIMSEENSEKYLKAIYKEINRRANFFPTQDEMNMIKKKLLNKFSESFENSAIVNDMTGKAILEGNLAMLTNYEKIVSEITPQDLVNTARKYFDLNKAAVTVVHPKSATIESINNNYKQVSFTGSTHKQAINMDLVNEYKLQNNFRIVTNNTQMRNATFLMEFTTEKPIEISNPAAPFVLNELLNQGSMFRDYERFTDDNNKNDINMAFSVGDNSIACAANSDSADVLRALASAKEVLYGPRFNQEALDEVKSNIKDCIKRAEKSPMDKLDAELFKGHLAGISDEEIAENIDKLTVDDIKNLYAGIMSQAKASFTISAPLRQNPQLMNGILAELSQCPKVTDFPSKLYDDYKAEESSPVLTDIHNKNQADIVMAYKFPVNGNLKDTVTLELLNTILGGGPTSRLFNDLREKQKLAYSVRSKLTHSHNSEAIVLSIGTTTENKDTGEISYDNVQKSLEGFKYHIEKLKSQKVSTEELESAKLAMKDDILTHNQSGCGKCINLSYSLNTPYGLTRENQKLDLIDSITVDDIYNAANYVFSGKPVYSIVATENTLKNNEEYLKTLSE